MLEMGGDYMIYTAKYNLPIGQVLVASRNSKLIGLWLEGQKYYLGDLKDNIKENEREEILIKTKKWLDRYFDNKHPKIEELEIELIGSEFRKSVWKLLCEIEYGKVTTYSDISKKLMKILNKEKMSAQAVGNAVSHNPISIIIPCHRVIGKNGKLVGYAGGIDKKIKLLEHENVDKNNLFK